MKLLTKLRRLSIIAAVTIGLTATAQAATMKIGVSVPSADHGWTAGLLWWANKAAADLESKYDDTEYFVVAANSGTKQVADVEDLLVKGIDALVILPHNPATLQRAIAEAYNEGVYTVVVDRELEVPTQNVFLAGDNPGMGEEAAKYMAKEMNGKGNIVVLEGMPIPINDQRVDAFEAEMAKYKNIEILDSQPADWNPQKALSVMENMLRKHKQIDAVWAGDDDMLKAAMKAIQESGRSDIKLVVGGGGSKEVIKLVKNGDPIVRGTVTYPPSMIASGMALAVHGLRGESLGNMYHGIPSRVVLAAELITEQNAETYYQPKAAY
ncbi:substrate-binding domain-containing protein [Vibrio kyushuensis]|uniref:substrate-binding domain-containing protein n=1 Tax=Vibrio TaxID=662 RepID=UPI003D0C444D